MYGPGTVLDGRYRLSVLIGAGGMGEVWRATDNRLERTVAVKVIKPDLLADQPALRRFRAEALAMARVKHPGVVMIHDVHHSPSEAFLVMEYVDGEALSDRLSREGRLIPATAMTLMAQAAEALQSVHDLGIVHRDVKPSNLLLSKTDMIVLTDFGIARLRDATGVTATGSVLGTPSYMSPEQVLGEPVTLLSDVYSLGVVAYECLTGRRPFERDNPFTVAVARVQESPPTLTGDIPSAVCEVVERAMARQPEQRWPSAAKLAAACRRAITSDPAPLARPRPPLPAPPPSAPHNRNQIVVARGLCAASDRIRLMLGPLGRQVLVQGEDDDYVETDDPRMFMAKYHSTDPQDRLGVGYAAGIVDRVHREAGDGTAMAVVLAHAMVDGAAAAMRAGANPTALAGGVQAGTTRAIAELAKLARHVQSKEQVQAYATMVSGDPVGGAIIAEAMDKVGRAGGILVAEGNAFGLELILTEGACIDAGYVSPHFVTDAERLEAVLEDPYILVLDGKLSKVAGLLPLLEKVMQANRPLLVIAQEVDREALATLVLNKLRDTFKSIAVRAPGSGDHRNDLLHDLAILTGGEVISLNSWDGLRETTLERLGRARLVVATDKSTTIVDAAGDGHEILTRVDQIRTKIEKSYAGPDRENLQHRLAKLAGGVAEIRVGGTEGELAKRKVVLERALRASRLAVAEGLLPGGGTSLCRVAPAVATMVDESDRGAGILLVGNALGAPYHQILANAGIPAPDKAGLEINVLSGTHADLVGAGIFDANGVLRCALEAAAHATVRFLSVA